MKILKQYGLNEYHMKNYDLYKDLNNEYKNINLARIIYHNRDLYKIITNDGEKLAKISGKLRYTIKNISNFPAIGDFVVVSYNDDINNAIIHSVLNRKTVFLRKAVASKVENQVISSNIDIAFICMSLNSNFNLNRLERYLAIAWDSGAKPVIVLTKSDLCDDLINKIQEVENVSLYSDIIVTSIYENIQDKFEQYLKYGITATFIGSSGVGKSTLINELINDNKLKVNKIDKYDKGKHTTTERQLFLSKFGGVVIDTPGMREIGVSNINLEKEFIDIDDIAKECKFRNCSHINEPNCAIKKDLKVGIIDERRLNNYLKLKNENSYNGLTSREIENKKVDRMFKEVGGIKNVKKFIKNKAKNKKI